MTRPASSEAVGLVDAFDASVDKLHGYADDPGPPDHRAARCDAVVRARNAARAALLAHIAATEQRALDEKARADAAEAMLVTYKAAVSRHLQLSMEAILDSTEPVNVALKRADAAEAREAGLRAAVAVAVGRLDTIVAVLHERREIDGMIETGRVVEHLRSALKESP